jgi:hypothetical protein
MTDGIYKPQQYRILSMTLYMNNQSLAPVDLLPIYHEVGIYENLFEGAAVSGYVFVTDVLGLIENLNLSGFNYVNIKLSKFGEDDQNAISRTFRVYKIGERQTINNNKEVYSLHFCSEEQILSEQIKIVKSYPNTQISTIIKAILNADGLKVDSSKLGTIEDTKGQYSFIVPNLRPFEAINWLATYARPLSNPGADMLFYETAMSGFNFRSLQSIYNDPVYTSFGYSPQNLSQLSFDDQYRSILAYSYLQISDIIQGINDGMFANKLVSIDPLLRSSNTTTFNYSNYFSTSQHLNQYPVSVEMNNRLGKTTSQNADASFKLLVGNSLERTYSGIKAKGAAAIASTAPDIGVETYIPNRTAQIPLANAIRVQVTVPGDPALNVGKVVKLNLPSFRYKDDGTPNVDVYFSGKYIISAVKHQFNSRGLYHCIAEAISDSVSKPYINPITDNSIVGK